MTKKTAIVTGASSGIGKDIAIALAKSGWNIALTYNSDAAGAADTKAKIEANGRQCVAMQCDAGTAKDVDSFFAALQDTLGVPTLLVNNAGVQTWAPLLELREEDWDRTIRTNLKGGFLNTQAAARCMVDAGVGGSIIMIGSGCNKTPFPNLIDYTASKGGLEMFTKAAAVDLGKYGIRVNCVAPGAILIERTKEEAPDYEKTWSELAPVGKVGVPEDIAHTVEFLASDKASFITGQTIYVDGGVFTKPNWPYQEGEG